MPIINTDKIITEITYDDKKDEFIISGIIETILPVSNTMWTTQLFELRMKNK